MQPIKDYDHPYVCTDAVVFTIKTEGVDNYRKLPETKLNLLLYKRTHDPFESKWCLPGGFINIDELPEDNIKRKLADKAQVQNCYLEQLYSFCALNRDPRARVISITYLGLMKEAESQKISNEQWFEVILEGQQLNLRNKDLTLNAADLGFDHHQIIEMAVERLQAKILYSDIALNLLPETFTLTQMQNVYEAILGKKETPANFRRKTADWVQETDQYVADKGHRPAKLFTKANL